MTSARTLGVLALAGVVAFAAAYLLSSSVGARVSAPGTVRTLSFPAPAVTVPATTAAGLPALARAPRQRRVRRPVVPPAGSPAPVPIPAPAPAPAPTPAPAPPSGGGGGGGGIIEG